MDLYQGDCFPQWLSQKALKIEKQKLSVSHKPVPFWPPLLFLFDNRLEQNPKLISHAFIHYNPGS